MTVDQTNIVDAIGIDETTQMVHLSISDNLPWTSDHLFKLQEKLNAYLRFLESGEVYTMYPNAKGRKFAIQIYFKYRPTEKELRFLEEIKTTIRSGGFDLLFGPITEGYLDDNG